MSGYKMKDRGAMNPLIRLPLYCGEDSFIQSCAHCFPTNIHMDCEKAEIYQEFHAFFGFFKVYQD